MDEGVISKKFLGAALIWTSLIVLSMIISFNYLVLWYLKYQVIAYILTHLAILGIFTIIYLISRVEYEDEELANKAYVITTIGFIIIALIILFVLPIFS